MKKSSWILTGFVFLKFILQYFLISPEYDLHRDEYLHLDQAKHLAWGYLSVPPVTSWISTIIYFLGNSVFWVKFFPALFGALTIVVVWKAIEELKGSLFALILGASCVLFSVILRVNTLYQPNSLDILCWTLLYFALIKYFTTDNRNWLFATALIFAFGFLNKYNIVFLIVGFFPALLITRQRNTFLKKDFYIALAIAILCILPNLMWQYKNDFPVFHHLEQLEKTQLVNVDRIDFLKNQLLFFISSFIVIISALYALLFYKPYLKYRPFLWSFFFTLLIFIYLRAKDYYAIGLYPIYIAFGSVFMADWLENGWRQYLKPILIAIPVLTFIPLYNVAFPNKTPEYIIKHSANYKKLGLLRWEDGKDHTLPQDFADMLGWKELAGKVDNVYANLPNRHQTLVLCDNYGQAGAINYYTKQGIQAVSFNADYINWFKLDKPYVNLIRIKEHQEKEDELAETSPHFNNAVAADSITNPYAREYKTVIFAFTDAKVDVNKRIQKEINEIG